MLTSQNKKLLILNILDILKTETDENHRLSQKDIIDRLECNYNMKVDRKAVKRNLMDLIDFGYEIEYETIPRGNSEDADPICTNWYLKRDITDAELRLLIDNLLLSKYIPRSQRKQLIEKLKKLSSRHFSAKVRHVCYLPERDGINKQFFFTVDVLDDAIERNRQVMFYYGTYRTDKKLHKKCDYTGEPIKYTVNPYQMAISCGKYYLIANVEPHNNIAHFRVDRIMDIEIDEDAPAKSVREVIGFENGLDLPRHMAEHIYMQSGKSEFVIFKIPLRHIDEVMDWFDGDVKFSEETENDVTVSVKVNRNAMKYWAIQYSTFVEVLSPLDLREEIGGTLAAAAKRYIKT